MLRIYSTVSIVSSDPLCHPATGQWEGYSPWGNRFLFTGREWMSDNGTSPPHNLKLYDYRNRIYQPELGRFMQPDPKEFGAGDYNLYRYCHNDPVNKSDPTGLQDEKPVIVREIIRSNLGSWFPIRITYTESGNWTNLRISDHYDPNLEKTKHLGGTTKGEGTVKQAGNEIRIDLKVNWFVDSKYANTDVVPRELKHVKDYHTFSNSFAKSLNSASLRSLTSFPDKVKNFEQDQREKYDATALRPNMPHNINEKYYPPRPFMLPTFENTNPYIPTSEPPY